MSGPQVVYESNVDYEASCQKLAENPLVVADVTEKGLLSFWFKRTRTLFQVSPKGKIQVKWSNVEEKKTLLKLAKNVLVAKEGQKLKITPLKQQLWISYPVPESFKLYWCDEETEFYRKEQVKSYCPETANALIYYRLLEKEYDCKAAKTIADLIEKYCGK